MLQAQKFPPSLKGVLTPEQFAEYATHGKQARRIRARNDRASAKSSGFRGSLPTAANTASTFKMDSQPKSMPDTIEVIFRVLFYGHGW